MAPQGVLRRRAAHARECGELVKAQFTAAVAPAFLRDNREHRVLLVSTELGSMALMPLRKVLQVMAEPVHDGLRRLVDFVVFRRVKNFCVFVSFRKVRAKVAGLGRRLMMNSTRASMHRLRSRSLGKLGKVAA